MSINDADYPAAVWDGLSPNTQRATRVVNQSPGYEDWDQIVAEVIAIETEVDAQTAANAALLIHNAVADNSAVVLAGTAVYLKAAGTFADADADGAAALRVAIGLLTTGGADSLAYDIALPGSKLTLTTAEWDAASDTTGGLTAGLKYYLDDAAGQLTETTPPPTTADTMMMVGVALSTTTMLIKMDDEGLRL